MSGKKFKQINSIHTLVYHRAYGFSYILYEGSSTVFKVGNDEFMDTYILVD